MTSADALLTLLDALETGGDIRMQLIRLQAWVKAAGANSVVSD